MADPARLDPNEMAAQALGTYSAEDIVEIDLRGGWGSTGLRNFGGIINEEYDPRLAGKRGLRTYRMMIDEDETVGSLAHVVSTMCRKATWTVDAASSRPGDRQAANHVEECMHDMEEPWPDTIDEILSMFWYGFSYHTQVLKRRMGDLGIAADPARSSRYRDGRVGWLGFPIRAQETIDRWIIDDHGRILGAEQVAMPRMRLVRLPMVKSLLFRTTKHKNNPEGRSLLRSAVRASYIKRGLQSIEAVGAERDVAGLPVIYLPAAILYGKDDAAVKQRAMYKNIVTGVRNDEKAGLLLPMIYDQAGHQMVKLELLAPGGAKQYDIDKIINRWDHRIAASLLADFLLLGQGPGATGSFAMHSDKTTLFAQTLDVYLNSVAETINRHAVPLLMRYNSFRMTDYPRIRAVSIDKPDLDAMGKYLTALAAAGMPLFPNPELEQHLAKLGDMPPPVDLEMALSGWGADEQSVAETAHQPSQITEVHDDLSTPGAGDETGKGEGAQGSQAIFGGDKVTKALDDQPRDDGGRWTSGSGGATTHSGKPIRDIGHSAYKDVAKRGSDKKRVAALYEGHQHFSAQDHQDASSYHRHQAAAARAQSVSQSGPAAEVAAKLADKHSTAAAMHRHLGQEVRLEVARTSHQVEKLKAELEHTKGELEKVRATPSAEKKKTAEDHLAKAERHRQKASEHAARGEFDKAAYQQRQENKARDAAFRASGQARQATPQNEPAVAPAAVVRRPGGPPRLTHGTETKTETVALGDYQGNRGGSSTEVNRALRNSKGKLSGKDKQRVEAIDTAIQKSSFASEGVVHRGIGDLRAAKLYAHLKPGDTYQEKGFVSTSQDPKLAARWGKGGKLTMHIAVQKGQHGLDINRAVSTDSHEKEVLLGHSQKFVVDRHYVDKAGMRHLHVRLL